MSSGPARRIEHSFESDLPQGIAELLVSGSLEMSPDHPEDAREIAALLPAGTCVYVNHLSRHALARSLPALAALRAAGLEPVPHVAARRIVSRVELATFLERAVGDAAVSKVLLIGGDDPQPLGPYADGAAVLREGILVEYGIRQVGLPGYPEGHARVSRAALRRALPDKLSLATAQGINAYVVTQFCFAPARVVEYCSELARQVPAIPVYVGLAGPADTRTLLRFAQICGVSVSLRALGAQGMGAIQLFTHTDPREQLAAVAHYCLGRGSCNVVGAHLFSFGGAAKTAAWMNREITFRASA